MDCLDRTNVVQGVFCRYVAFNQLNKMNLIDLPPGKRSPFEKFPSALEDVFRCGWTNNADAMSYLYTGTPALKTDFTRTGKRTHQGAINDGINSVTRYYINNFTDGHYHDCLDIATLKIMPSSYLKPKGFITPLKISMFVFVIWVLACKWIADTMILPLPVEDAVLTYKESFFHKSAILVSILVGLGMIIKNGRNFIDDASRFV